MRTVTVPGTKIVNKMVFTTGLRACLINPGRQQDSPRNVTVKLIATEQNRYAASSFSSEILKSREDSFSTKIRRSGPRLIATGTRETLLRKH